MTEFTILFVERLAYATLLLAVAGGCVWLITRRGGQSPEMLALCHWLVLSQGLLLLPVTLSIAIAPPAPDPRLEIAQQRLVNSSPDHPETPHRVSGSSSTDRVALPSNVTTTAADRESLWIPVTNAISEVSISACLTATWLIGFLVVNTRLFWSYARLVRSKRSHCRCLDQAWLDQWTEIQQRLDVAKHIPMYESPDFGPALCWFPTGYRLIVPKCLWQGLTDGQRQAVLLHELAHYKRVDILRILVSRVLASVHWFNPVVWWSAGQIELSGEWAADDLVKREQPSVATLFARALLEIGHSDVRGSFGSAAASGGALGTRIRRLTSPSGSKETKMKKLCMILPLVAISLTSLLRIELVAQEPITVDASSPQQKEKPTEKPTETPIIDDVDNDARQPSAVAKPAEANHVSEIDPMVRVLQLADQWISKQDDVAEQLADEVVILLYPEQDRAKYFGAVRSAFNAVGVPQGVFSSRLADASSKSWLLGDKQGGDKQGGDKQVAYEYEVDYPLLFSDLGRFTNAALGDNIFEDILDGIKNDKDGPRIDIRRDLVQQLSDRLIIAADVSGNKPYVIAAFSIKDERAATRIRDHVLQPAFRIEPDATITRLNGIDVYESPPNNARREPAAFCVVGNQLLIGQIDLVRAVAGRVVKPRGNPAQ